MKLLVGFVQLPDLLVGVEVRAAIFAMRNLMVAGVASFFIWHKERVVLLKGLRARI